MRLVDTDKLYPDVMKADGSMAISQGQLAHAPTVEAIPKAEYKNRLNADMVATLKELQLEIEKHTMTNGVTNQGTWNECIACCSRIIQQEINALKGANNE